MYNGAKSKVRVNGSYSGEFEVRVGVHQGSLLSLLLFIMHSLALSSLETLDLLMEILKLWKVKYRKYNPMCKHRENKSDYLWERFGYYKTISKVFM